MSSHAFRDWWANRSQEEPVPSNPYQAYMIDLSLSAKIENRHKWENAPNESDQIQIDFPFAGAPNYAPAHKPPQRYEPTEKSPEMPKSGLSRELQIAADEMAIKYGIPAPIVNTFSGGINRSYARVGVGRFHGQLIKAGGGVVNIGMRNVGERKTLTPVEYGTLYHEVGHVIHAQTSVLPEGQRPKNMTNLFSASPLNYSDEHFATVFAREQIKRKLKTKGEQPIAMWDLRYALHTYQVGWKHRGKPVKIDTLGNILSGGSF